MIIVIITVAINDVMMQGCLWYIRGLTSYRAVLPVLRVLTWYKIHQCY